MERRIRNCNFILGKFYLKIYQRHSTDLELDPAPKPVESEAANLGNISPTQKIVENRFILRSRQDFQRPSAFSCGAQWANSEKKRQNFENH